LIQETTQALVERGGEHEGSECLSFSCSLPNAVGRGFVEVLIYHILPFLVVIYFPPLLNVYFRIFRYELRLRTMALAAASFHS